MDNYSKIPENYRSVLGVIETEEAIKLIKDFFQIKLAEALDLRRVTAPLFVEAGTGVNDDLTGIENPLTFHIKNMPDTTAEIVEIIREALCTPSE